MPHRRRGEPPRRTPAEARRPTTTAARARDVAAGEPLRRPAGRYDKGPGRGVRVLLWIIAGWAVLLAIGLSVAIVVSLAHIAPLLAVASGLGVGVLLAIANACAKTARRRPDG